MIDSINGFMKAKLVPHCIVGKMKLAMQPWTSEEFVMKANRNESADTLIHFIFLVNKAFIGGTINDNHPEQIGEVMEAMAQERVGLRERKKAHRHQAILTAARELFAQAGYEATTIESIAEHVGISGVTVHNYFGTKSGVLLALVAESDAVLCDEIDDRLANAPEDTVGLVLYFAQTVRQHAITYLDRALWRHVLAASVLEGNSRFGRSYHTLDRQLAHALGRQLERLQALGAVPEHVDTTVLGAALFDVQNTTFARFVSDESLDEATMDAWLERDLSALVSIGFASTK